MKLIGHATLFGAAASCALMVAAAPAQAQATRTWVSGTGDDANPCTRQQPCRTFFEAVTKTTDDGTISCVDAGGYGNVTVETGLTIDCTGTFGNVLNSGTSGISINAPGEKVVIRGLQINGGTPTFAGGPGIRIRNATSVTIDNVIVHDQHSGPGIEIAPSSGTVAVFINNSVLADNGNGAAAGIQVRPTGTALVRLSMDGVKILGTTGNALRLDSAATSGLGILTIIDNSNFSNSSGSGISAVAGSAPSRFNVSLVTNSNISNNGNAGIETSGAAARVRVGNTSLSLNGTGISPSTGFVNNLGGNFVVGNSVDGAFN